MIFTELVNVSTFVQMCVLYVYYIWQLSYALDIILICHFGKKLTWHLSLVGFGKILKLNLGDLVSQLRRFL